MKKYLSVLKMSFIESFSFLPTLFFRFISYFINMFALTSVWKYVYSDPSQVINGYTLNQMIWYLLLAETISYGASNLPEKEILEDVKSGGIAYKINKPYHYVLYNYIRYLGDSFIRLFMYLIVSILIGLLFTKEFIFELNILNILCILVTVFFALTINGLIRILISLSSLWVEDSTPFHWIYKKIILIFGIFFPIEMFPEFLRPIIKCTPVFTVIYGPVKLILSFSYELFFTILLSQIVYFIIIGLLMNIVFKKGVKKLNVNGG